MPGDYDSFAVAILSQNYMEIDIAKSILVSIKVITADNVSWGFLSCRHYGHQLQFDSWGVENCHFLAQGISSPPHFTVIPKTPFYEDTVVGIL